MRFSYGARGAFLPSPPPPEEFLWITDDLKFVIDDSGENVLVD